MIIIKNGTLVTDIEQKADLAVDGDKIVSIASDLRPQDGDEVIDATDCYVFPGFIDPHTHLQMDNGKIVTADSFETGTAAAVAGGTTTFIDFATQDKGGTLKEAYEKWLAMAKDCSSTNYRFHMAIVDYNDEVEKEIAEMDALGISSFKIYLAYDALRINDGEVLRCLRAVKKAGGLLGAHCENGDLVNEGIRREHELGHMGPEAHPVSRPPIVEAESINRFACIGEMADWSVHVVHLSSEEGLKAVRAARARGAKVTVETCPQYLLLDDTNYSKPDFEGAKYVMSPPLRKKSDNEALLEALLNGEIETVATDHCSYNFKGQKDLGRDDFAKIPNGGPGIEHRVVAMYTLLVASGKMSAVDFCKLMSTNAAKLYHLYPQKGVLAEGSDADIVVYKKTGGYTIKAEDQLQNVDYTPMEGFEVVGGVKDVVLNGYHVVQDSKLVLRNKGRYAR